MTGYSLKFMIKNIPPSADVKTTFKSFDPDLKALIIIFDKNILTKSTEIVNGI